MQDLLERSDLARPLAIALHRELRPTWRGGGKMFGVLVARAPNGELVTLRAFSGLLEGSWHHEGYAPPIFDEAARAAIEVPGEALVKRLLAEEAALPDRRAEHTRAVAEMQQRHRENKTRRKERRKTEDGLALDQESRADKAERRRLDEAFAPIERRRRALERLRRIVCKRLMRAIHDTYVIDGRPLRELFAPGEPPAGAGDCAAPKLLVWAKAKGLEPVSLAEIFVGDGARKDGELSPPCSLKCAPILAHLLGRNAPPSLRVIYEDDTLIVVDKPAGLLSVPGKLEDDSVLTRLQRAHPNVMLVHRLDLDTSGLLVACKDIDTYRTLQRQFAERSVDKRYVAILSAAPAHTKGRIDLPLRVDVDARPRQIVDPIHGKAAITDYEVITGARVVFTPLTGRTHQLRVHSAQGLGAPIKGDRLYGNGGDRLHLHAASIAFVHPQTGAAVRFESVVPF